MQVSIALASLVTIGTLAVSPAVAQTQQDATPVAAASPISFSASAPRQIDLLALNQDLAVKAKMARPPERAPASNIDGVTKMVASRVAEARAYVGALPHF